MNPSGEERNEGGDAPTDTDTALSFSSRLMPVTGHHPRLPGRTSEAVDPVARPVGVGRY